MITGGTEAVLISDVVHSDLVAVLIGVRVESLGDLDLMVLLAGILHVSMLLLVDAIGSLELVLVRTVLVRVRLALKDWDVLVLLLLLLVINGGVGDGRWLMVVVILLLLLLFVLDNGVQLLVMLGLVLLQLLRLIVRVLHLSRVVLLLRVIIHFGCGDNGDHGQECDELEGETRDECVIMGFVQECTCEGGCDVLTNFIMRMIGLIELVGDVHRLKDLERLDLVTGEFHYLYAVRWWWRRHWNYAQNSFERCEQGDQIHLGKWWEWHGIGWERREVVW